MNRAERRRQERAMDKAIQAGDAMRVLEIASASTDAERPLAYTGGYQHTVCGGAAERANNFGAGAFCLACGHTVPVEETRRIRNG